MRRIVTLVLCKGEGPKPTIGVKEMKENVCWGAWKSVDDLNSITIGQWIPVLLDNMAMMPDGITPTEYDKEISE